MAVIVFRKDQRHNLTYISVAMYSCVNYYHDGFNEKILGKIHVCFNAYIVAEVRDWFAKVQIFWQQPI